MSRWGRRTAKWRQAVTGALASILLLSTPLAAPTAADPATDATVPTPTITGPIKVVEGSYPWFASEIDLASLGYVEEEYFMEGNARTYKGSEVTGESPYKTRIMVRRPKSVKTFSGVVAIEWFNVTYGYDIEFDWFNSHEFFARNGWVWIGVSAQARGVDNLRLWDEARYGSLHVSDEQSADIFPQAAKALRTRTGADPMGGLRPDILIADGHSQSAYQLAEYYNNQHGRDGLFDGFLVRGYKSPIRNDLPTKVFRLLSETDLFIFNTFPFPHDTPDLPNSDHFRDWEVAGTSHVTWKEFRQITALLQRERTPWDPSICTKPPHSKIPFDHAQNAAYHHLELWIRGRTDPPVSPRLTREPDGTLKRDESGFVIGGIRLPELHVPTELQTGENLGVVFCVLYGSREAFSHEELMSRYPDRASYVRKMDDAIRQSVREGFLLSEDAQEVCLAARRAQLGWPEQQPPTSDRGCRKLAPR